MPAEVMTLQEFQEQASRLHKRYPWIYPGRKQVELAWHVHGLDLEWFKFRVDYVIRSGDGHYNWKNAAMARRKVVQEQEVRTASPVEIVLQGMRRDCAGAVEHQVQTETSECTTEELKPSDEVSAWDLVEQKRSQGGEVEYE